MDKEDIKRHIQEMLNSEGWKIYQEHIESEIDRINKLLIRDGLSESDMLNSNNNIPVYNMYDLLALYRNKIKSIKSIPDKILNTSDSIAQKDMSKYL